MPNKASWNPIYIDTSPFVWQPDALGNPTIIPIRIKTIVWSGYGAATDKAVVKDARGNFIWNASGYAADFQQESPNIGDVNGLQVTQLTAGVLQIYLSFKGG